MSTELTFSTAIILGVVEGLTEFLPVSSTGHLIIAGSLLGFTGEKAKLFEIVIQAGAIMAICWEYRRKLFDVARNVFHETSAQRFVLNLFIAFLPAAILGLLFGRAIKHSLFAPIPVASAFIVGALIILWAERRQQRLFGRPRIDSVDDIGVLDALKIGAAQAFALIPGTSRSGATIIGGMLFGLSRKAATEFSFFLAIPTLVAATAYDLYKNHPLLSRDDTGMFVVGLVAAFVSALLAVRALIRYVSRHDFIPFAWYRIAFGVLVLVTAYAKLVTWE